MAERRISGYDFVGRRDSSLGWKHQPHPSAKTAEAEGSLQILDCFSGKELGETVFCVRYSHDGKYLAATFGNGSMRVFDTKTWDLVTRVKPLSHNPESLAMTSVRWRPHCPRRSYDLLTVCASGDVTLWNWDQDDPKGELDYQAHIQEPGNEVMCCDYAKDGNLFATAGSDHVVRVYDTMSTKIAHELRHGVDQRGYIRDAHPSRIFSAKFCGPHTLVTGGWQTACQVWDLRTGKSERQLMGSHICADSIEINVNTSHVVVSSYRTHDQLCVYDWLSGRECTPEGLSRNLGDTMLYSSRLCSDQTTLWCCGSKPNCIFHLDTRTGELKGAVRELSSTFFTCTMNPQNNYEAVFGGSKDCIMRVGQKEPVVVP
eukprot:Hpha_TRINITY_DN15933_c4_g4::TRINITY_DN15933_c4_g4_i1::g.72969::m.72969